MNNIKPSNERQSWTVQDSATLYGLDQWGDEYFSINEKGNIEISPKGKPSQVLDLLDLAKELNSRNLALPLLLRFDDILEDRVNKLNKAFEKAINHYNYDGNYQGVFPIKCNQQRHVVEELVSCGRSWNVGLEVGSKAELLIALSLLDNERAFLICNGFKDQRYIETAILARKLGRQPIIVIEQSEEVERIIKATNEIGSSPLIGIRAKLSSRSSGRWKDSIGEKAKFGLSIPDILRTIEKLKSANLLSDLKMLHFHIGSQINDIAILKDALQEAGQIYVELTHLGAPMGNLNVGGGLAVDYDGSKTSTAASTNYSLQNYANDVVATVQEICVSNKIKMPTLVSESGRAIASHFSILLFNILGTDVVCADEPEMQSNECLIIRNLRETLKSIKEINASNNYDLSRIQEAWNDAIKFKEDALAGFRLGYLNLTERAIAEQLTWACAKSLGESLANIDYIPEELQTLQTSLSSTYYANLSVFRSTPDAWAINQLFPIMPIHRLNEKPSKFGHFADLTCDSDGKLFNFINNGQIKNLLELHEMKKDQAYIIGIFLGGAYQEVMGNLHNLFGSTNAVHVRLTKNGNYQLDHVVKGNTKSEVLKAMEHDPEDLLERLRIASENAIQKGHLEISDARRLMDHLETSLRQSTYLQE